MKKIDWIELTNVSENNLKDISLEIPKHRLTVFTGVSGAGKSSLVFDTIAAEAQRQLKATYTNYLPLAGQPEADTIENLSPAVVIGQKKIQGGPRSTVGTFTEIYSLLRLLYSREGTPDAGYSNAFSFNESEGMCPECEGLGEAVSVDVEKLVDKTKSLNQGAIKFTQLYKEWQRYVDRGLFDGKKKLANYTDSEWELFLHGNAKVDVKTRGRTVELNYEGLVDTFRRRYIKRDISSLAASTRAEIQRFLIRKTCSECGGARINQAALASEIDGYNIAQLAALETEKLHEVMKEMEVSAGSPIVSSIIDGLENLVSIGLGYLTLNRRTSTLSGGEAQRVKMVKHLGSSLTDLLYIFDEPTIGLHPRDVEGLNDYLLKLRDGGNTVLVVEHDPDVIEIADHIVDLGPGAGVNGGEVVYDGSFAELCENDTPTGRQLNARSVLKSNFRSPSGQMKIANASRHNLRDITVNIPAGVLTVVTGVAGAGKSTLLELFLEEYPQAISIDQAPLNTSTRSVTATYTDIMDDIRALFAEENEISRSLFSFNSAGACPECEGTGTVITELPFMDPVKSKCEVCGGKRYKKEVLKYSWREKSISEVLELTVSEALEFFQKSALTRTLGALEEVGLGYLKLGQPLSSFSGGECQRLKISNQLRQTGNIYLLDEPTTGLHLADLDQLLTILNRLVNEGNTVFVIAHNLEVVKQADWVIDLGPGGGTSGGEVVFEGTPSQLLEAENSFTAEYLKRALE